MSSASSLPAPPQPAGGAKKKRARKGPSPEQDGDGSTHLPFPKRAAAAHGGREKKDKIVAAESGETPQHDEGARSSALPPSDDDGGNSFELKLEFLDGYSFVPSCADGAPPPRDPPASSTSPAQPDKDGSRPAEDEGNSTAAPLPPPPSRRPHLAPATTARRRMAATAASRGGRGGGGRGRGTTVPVVPGAAGGEPTDPRLQTRVSEYMCGLVHRLERPEAIDAFRSQLLDFDANPLGYVGSTQFSVRCGCLGQFAVAEKVRHPKCLIFVQKGKFFETIGVDAIVTMEVLGVKAMGGRPETGVPVQTVQFYLNRLTSAGLSVALYEEMEGRVIGAKERRLVQIVSPASPVYYSVHTVGDLFEAAPEALPVIAVVAPQQQHNARRRLDVYIFDVEARAVEKEEGICAERARTYLGVPNLGVVSVGNVPQSVLRDVPHCALRGLAPGALPFAVVAEALATDFEVHEPLRFRITTHSAASRSSAASGAGATPGRRYPLPRLTALQLGILPGLAHAPPLLEAVAGGNAARLVKKLLSKYLLFPSEERRAANERVIRALGAMRASMPPKALATDPVRVNATLFHPAHVTPELLKLVRTSLVIFERFASGGGRSPLTRALHEGLWEAAGVECSSTSGPPPHGVGAPRHHRRGTDDDLERDVHDEADAMQRDDSIETGAPPGTRDRGLVETSVERLLLAMRELLPDEDAAPPAPNAIGDVRINHFFAKVEDYKSRVAPAVVSEQTAAVDEAFGLLHDAILAAVSGAAEGTWENSLHAVNGTVCFKNKAVLSASTQVKELLQDKQQKGAASNSVAGNTKYFSTPEVIAAVQGYMRACYMADLKVAALCADAAAALRTAGDGEDIRFVLHYAAVYSVLSVHAHASVRQGWKCRAKEDDDDDACLRLQGFRPYWLSKTEGVPNSIVFDGARKGVLLSGANAFGKSTLLRSVASCCALRNAGLCAPCEVNRGGGFRNVFLKVGNTDDASRKLSSFTNECSELANCLQIGSGETSLYLLDEVMRGTSTAEGAALTGALAEHLEHQDGAASIISTHFRELYQMELNLERTRFMRMEAGTHGEKTFKLVDGKCNDTRAYETALACHLDASLVQRAMEIAQAVERAEEAKAAAAKRCAEVDVDRADGSASGGSSGGDGRGEKEVDAVGVSGTGGAPPARNILPFSDDLMLLVPGTLLAVAGSGKDEEVGVMFGRDELPPTVSCALYVVVLPTRTYVGETADLSRRIEEHRTSGMLPRRSSSRLFYVSVENKSVGRQLETTLQMRLSDMGVAQVSMVDAAHKSF